MPKRAAGIVLYRRQTTGSIELLLGHFGGPYYTNKDAGAWTVPKGLVETGESDWAAACREWREETGQPVPSGAPIELPLFRQNSSKEAKLYAVAGEIDIGELHANTFTMEWPPRSGQWQHFPELDRFGWFGLEEARVKLTKGLVPLVDFIAAF